MATNVLKPSLQNMQIYEFALKPSLQNLHDGNKLKTKVSNPFEKIFSHKINIWMASFLHELM